MHTAQARASPHAGIHQSLTKPKMCGGRSHTHLLAALQRALAAQQVSVLLHAAAAPAAAGCMCAHHGQADRSCCTFAAFVVQAVQAMNAHAGRGWQRCGLAAHRRCMLAAVQECWRVQRATGWCAALLMLLLLQLLLLLLLLLHAEHVCVRCGQTDHRCCTHTAASLRMCARCALDGHKHRMVLQQEGSKQ